MGLGEELIKTIQIIVNRKLNNFKADRTYQSVIKQVTKNGYVVLDQSGSERTVNCCIPNITLKAGQRVWLKEPMSNIRNLHITGIVS